MAKNSESVYLTIFKKKYKSNILELKLIPKFHYSLKQRNINNIIQHCFHAKVYITV